MTTLTAEQAYAAMFHFLETFWESTKSDEVAGLLGSMALLQDGKPADAAMWNDWNKSVDYALSGGKAGALVLGKAK